MATIESFERGTCIQCQEPNRMLATSLSPTGRVCFSCLGLHTSKPLKLKPNAEFDITGQEVECWQPYCQRCSSYINSGECKCS